MMQLTKVEEYAEFIDFIAEKYPYFFNNILCPEFEKFRKAKIQHTP